jgi:hypothetical protein
MRMSSAWFRKLWSARAVLHLFVAGVVLGLPLAGQAQTMVNVVSVAGGSSALLGEFSVLTFRQGPVPQVLEDSPFAITGYRPAGVPDDGLLVVTNAIIRDPSTKDPSMDPLETVAAAMVRWHRQDDNNINVIILLRSDSGNGVRYVANFARITDFPSEGSGASVWKQRQSDGSFADPNGDGLIVMNGLLNQLAPDRGYDGSQLPIATGYSDVTADTIVRYANFANINVPGLQGILTPGTYGPVQTLLLLYNMNTVYSTLGAYQVVFPRESGTPPFSGVGVRDLLNMNGSQTRWSDIDPRLLAAPVLPARRENTSGTRNTEYVNIQRILPGNPLMFVGDDTTNVASGTGPMLNFVDLEFSAFAYAFVGGVNGNNRSNIRVGMYMDSNGNTSRPYPITNGAGPDCPLPNNFNQQPYSEDPTALYQTGVVDGTYPLWSYANFFSRPEGNYAGAAAAQADIFNALLVSSNPDSVHKEGLLRPTEIMVERNYFISSITGEKVTDGQRVVPIGTAVQVNEPPNDDPNP